MHEPVAGLTQGHMGSYLVQLLLPLPQISGKCQARMWVEPLSLSHPSSHSPLCRPHLCQDSWPISDTFSGSVLEITYFPTG